MYLFLVTMVVLFMLVNSKHNQVGGALDCTTCGQGEKCPPDGCNRDIYTSAFNRTGCPNQKPGTSWWKSQPISVALNDMYAYCDLTRKGRANKTQIRQCCGPKPCKPSKCNKQKTLMKDPYVSAFNNTGCPNQNPSYRGNSNWWRQKSEAGALNDMFAYCDLTKKGRADARQKRTCCGSTPCKVTRCSKQPRLYNKDYYINTFNSTGCPNPNPSVGWWMKQRPRAALSDMYAYCNLTKTGRANPTQIRQCCGPKKKCKPKRCNRPNDYNYF